MPTAQQKPTPDNIPADISRIKFEKTKEHRGLLLWGMQDPKATRWGRSNRATAKAVGMSEAATRAWQDKWHWKHRIAGLGLHADQQCLDMYRHLYMREYGSAELPCVAHLVTVPLGGAAHPQGSNAADTIQQASDAVRTAVPRAMQVIEQSVTGELAKMKAEERMAANRHLKLVDACLGLIAKRLKDKDLKVSVRDIPTLLETRGKLIEIMMGTNHAEGGQRFTESARVKHAKENGHDLVDAMFDDAVELVAILGVLRTKREAEQRDGERVILAVED